MVSGKVARMTEEKIRNTIREEISKFLRGMRFTIRPLRTRNQ